MNFCHLDWFKIPQENHFFDISHLGVDIKNQNATLSSTQCLIKPLCKQATNHLTFWNETKTLTNQFVLSFVHKWRDSLQRECKTTPNRGGGGGLGQPNAQGHTNQFEFVNIESHGWICNFICQWVNWTKFLTKAQIEIKWL